MNSLKQENVTREPTYEEDKQLKTVVTVGKAKDVSFLPHSTQLVQLPEQVTVKEVKKATMKVIHKEKKTKLKLTKKELSKFKSLYIMMIDENERFL